MDRRLVGTFQMAHGQGRNDAGLAAFLGMNAWFTKTTGLRQSERMASLITPNQVKSDEDIADAVEAWAREAADLDRVDTTAGLGEPWRMTAIQNLRPRDLRSTLI